MDLTSIVGSLIVLSVISIIINCACIYVIKTKISLPDKPSSILILNLLVTHLFQGVFVFPLYAGKKMKVKDLYWRRFFDTGFLFTYMISFYGVCLGVLNISFDRFLATYLLNRYKLFVTYRNVVTFISGTWVYVIVLSLVPFIPQVKPTFDVRRPTFKSNVTVNNTSNNMTLSNSNNITLHSTRLQTNFYRPQKEWTVFMLFFNAALPLLLIVFCYIYVVYRLKRIEKARSEHTETPKRPKVKGFKIYKQITQLSMVLTSVYFFMWSPSVVYYTILIACEQRCFVENWDNSIAEKHVVFIIKYLSFLNAIFSPVIYCFRHPDMKKVMFKKKKDTLLPPKPTNSGSNSGFEMKERSSRESSK